MPRPAALLAGCALVLVGSAACAKGESAEPTATTTPATAAPARNPLAPNPADPDQVQGVHEAMVPDDQPDPTQFAFGQEVRVSDTTIQPAQLVAKVNKELAFTNTSQVPVTIEFINGAISEASDAKTAAIAPGESFRFTPTIMRSITFRLQGQPDVRGAVLVDVADYEP